MLNPPATDSGAPASEWGVAAACGHSQGMAAAVVAALAGDGTVERSSYVASLTEHGATMVAGLFWLGLRLQDAMDSLPPRPGTPADPSARPHGRAPSAAPPMAVCPANGGASTETCFDRDAAQRRAVSQTMSTSCLATKINPMGYAPGAARGRDTGARDPPG